MPLWNPLKANTIACPCGQQVDPLGNDPTIRLSHVYHDLAVHQGPDGKWHSCCNRDPRKPMAPGYYNHTED
jgi:hypothetical protein